MLLLTGEVTPSRLKTGTRIEPHLFPTKCNVLKLQGFNLKLFWPFSNPDTKLGLPEYTWLNLGSDIDDISPKIDRWLLPKVLGSY